jgi:hypothetical protein
MSLRRLVVCLSLACAASLALATPQEPKFIKIHEGRHWTWWAREDQYAKQKSDIEAMYAYADKAFDKLCDFWGLKPKKDKYFLLVMDKPGGGFAAGNIGEISNVTKQESPGIGCSYDAFSGTANGIKAYWAHILITHEMVNLFTGQIVSGGWPFDWWADHRSPFPLMTAVRIEYALVPQMAVFHQKQGREDPMVVMFENMLDQYGWAMFRKSFKTAIEDGINWDAFGQNPSKLRTAYVCAYLQLGAPEDISAILATQVPDFDAAVVKDIVKAHAKWASLPAYSDKRKEMQKAFLKGDYKACLK